MQQQQQQQRANQATSSNRIVPFLLALSRVVPLDFLATPGWQLLTLGKEGGSHERRVCHVRSGVQQDDADDCI
jgi:hypothetical protein